MKDRNGNSIIHDKICMRNSIYLLAAIVCKLENIIDKLL